MGTRISILCVPVLAAVAVVGLAQAPQTGSLVFGAREHHGKIVGTVRRSAETPFQGGN